MISIDSNALNPLWSTSDLRARSDSTPAERSFLVLPSIEHPRLVVPTRPHRAAGVILNALRDKSSFRARARTSALRAALATGVRGTRLPDPDLVAIALGSLPEDEYVYGVHLGPPRANRKPVLVLATTHGKLVAFVKWGVDPLTDRLVRTEASALAAVADLRAVHVPQLVATGDYRSHPYVVQSPVPTDGLGREDTAAVLAAQVEVATLGQGSVDVGAVLNAIAEQWRQRASAASEPDDEVLAFNELAQSWVELVKETPIAWGSWHGDWRRTNMAVSSSKCSVWDWERFATGVPVGYDALHMFLMSRASSVHDLTTLPADLFDNAERLLRPFDVSGREAAEVTTAGYLLELAGRYLDDHQSEAGARLGSVGDWLLPHLSAKLTLRETRHSGRGVNGL